MNWNVPNSLTLLRIAMIPLFVGVFYLPNQIVLADKNFYATLIFAIAALTDWLDGYWARKYNQMSAFGAFLDPVADKLMVAAALIVLVELNRIGAVIALIIIGREIAVSALREWMAGSGERSSLAVAFVGKLKTTMQMIAILFLLAFDAQNDLRIHSLSLYVLGQWLMVIAAILTLVSMAYYLRSAWPKMKAS